MWQSTINNESNDDYLRVMPAQGDAEWLITGELALKSAVIKDNT